jgi:rubrerythrin
MMAGRIGDDGLTRLERKAKLQAGGEIAKAEEAERVEELRSGALKDSARVLEILNKSMDEEVQAYTVYEQRAEQIREMTTIPHLRREVVALLKELIADENDHFRKLKAMAQLIEGG